MVSQNLLVERKSNFFLCEFKFYFVISLFFVK
jgi:hypothetical protein